MIKEDWMLAGSHLSRMKTGENEDHKSGLRDTGIRCRLEYTGITSLDADWGTQGSLKRQTALGNSGVTEVMLGGMRITGRIKRKHGGPPSSMWMCCSNTE